MVDRSAAGELFATGSMNGSDCSNESSTKVAEHSRAESSSEHGDYEIDEEIIKAAAAGNETFQSGLRRSSFAFAIDRNSTTQRVHNNRPPQDYCNRNTEFPQMSKDGDFILSLEKDIADVDQVLYRFCIHAVLAWLALIAFSYWAAPEESIVWLDGKERRAVFIEVCVLSTAVIMRHGPLFLNTNGRFGLRIPLHISGVLAAGLTVQFIAVSTSIFMASFPVPVMIDPMFHSRVHLVRWCEWTPLAGLITLLVSCIDAPNLQDVDMSKRWKKRFIGAGMESASTLCGLIFPFCHNKIVWCTVMAFCFLTYSSILWSYAEKAKKVLTNGKSVDEIEMHDRARLSLRLHGLCCLTWSGISVMYFIGSAGHLIVPESFKLLHDPAITMIEECFMDCVSKIFYMTVIIETHHAAFDEAKRAAKRLVELQNTMSAVWESSSDTIAILLQSKSGNLTSIVSPSFFRDGMKSQQEDEIHSSILLEIDVFSTNKRSCTFTNVESRLKIGDIPNVAMRLADAEFGQTNLRSLFGTSLYSIDPFGVDTSYLIKSKVLSLTDMLSRAWHATDESVFEHETVSLNGNSYFEIRVTKSDVSSIIVLIRDVSERYERHEAEKKGAYETSEREIDDQANRFAKHEIKNGLLGAIEVCELLGGQICGDFNKLQKPKISSKESLAASLAARFENVAELDTMLHEILDIILADTVSSFLVAEIDGK